MTALVLLGLSAAAVTPVSAAPISPAPKFRQLPIPECFGVAIHFVDQDLPEQIAYLKKAGIGVVRTDLFWSGVEIRKGEYDFSKYDKLVNALNDAGLRTILILDYGNKLYGGGPPTSPEARAAFVRFTQAAALRYSAKNVIWEIWNEPNGAFWKPTPDADAYTTLAEEATAALRVVAPYETIIGPALGGPISMKVISAWEVRTQSFLDRVLRSDAARAWSGISIHPYGLRNSKPEMIDEQFETVRGMMQQRNLSPQRTPIIATEIGYSSAENLYSERTQAAYVVRSYFWGMANRAPFTIWYDWQDDGNDPNNNEHHFGLLRSGALKGRLEPQVTKPSFQAVQQVSDALRGYHFETLERPNNSIFVMTLSDGQHKAFALWTGDDSDKDFEFRLPSGVWKIERLLGGSEDLQLDQAETRKLQLGAIPLLIVAH
jgi:hypothetical protein